MWARLLRRLDGDHLELQLLRRTAHGGKDRAQIARWERDVVQPSFETLRDLVRACGFDLELALVPHEADERDVARLRKALMRSPQERLQTMLKERRR